MPSIVSNTETAYPCTKYNVLLDCAIWQYICTPPASFTGKLYFQVKLVDILAGDQEQARHVELLSTSWMTVSEDCSRLHQLALYNLIETYDIWEIALGDIIYAIKVTDITCDIVGFETSMLSNTYISYTYDLFHHYTKAMFDINDLW